MPLDLATEIILNFHLGPFSEELWVGAKWQWTQSGMRSMEVEISDDSRHLAIRKSNTAEFLERTKVKRTSLF
jgi:anti-sigma factor ChrR (cupin superfamily)